MLRGNCTETIESLHSPLSVRRGVDVDRSVDVDMALTWRRWLANGRTLGMDEMRRVGAMVTLWRWRMRARHDLADMDTRMLRDIGITHAQANLESAKKFWQR